MKLYVTVTNDQGESTVIAVEAVDERAARWNATGLAREQQGWTSCSAGEVSRKRPVDMKPKENAAPPIPRRGVRVKSRDYAPKTPRSMVQETLW